MTTNLSPFLFVSFASFAFRSGKRSEFYGLHLTRNHRQMHRTVAFYIHLLVSGLHHHFSVQSHYSPLAGVFLVSAIIAHRRQNLPVFGRHNDTFPQFQAPFHPHPERQCIPDLFQPFQPFLFLFLQLFPLSDPGTRCPASSFRRSITVWKSSSPGRECYRLYTAFPSLSPHDNNSCSRPSPRCSGPPDGHSTNTLPPHPLPAHRRKHQTR